MFKNIFFFKKITKIGVTKNLDSGVGEVAQLVKYLLCKVGDLSLDPQNPVLMMKLCEITSEGLPLKKREREIIIKHI